MQLGLELVKKIWFESNWCTGRYAAWLRASEKFGSNQIFAQGDMQLGLELVKNLVRIKFLHREICSFPHSISTLCRPLFDPQNRVFSQKNSRIIVEDSTSNSSRSVREVAYIRSRIAK